jgi:ATP-dependent RNA helicase SUPV3L1/SUV3
VFERIRTRVAHAIEREQEERHALRTRQSINLAEYPDSFEVARRMPRKFVALLGPTNSGKTHRAMEALAKANSGVYLAPLRLLALENFERLQQVRPHGEPLKVSLVTGEERRLADGATHVASTVEMLDTRTRVEVAVIDEIQMLAARPRWSIWSVRPRRGAQSRRWPSGSRFRWRCTCSSAWARCQWSRAPCASCATCSAVTP